MAISRSASLSLDLLRAATASAVVLYHVSWLHLDEGALSFMTPKIGHSAVIVFFVLSGFVIAATTRRGSAAVDYAIKRGARVYSVAVPALLIIMALNYFALSRGVVPPDAYQLRQPVPYLGLHLLFGGDLWTLAITAFSIGPYWSLNYEVWYYVIFGVWFFTRGMVRYVAVVMALLLVGPKIVVLFPVWLAGAGIYALSLRWTLPRGAARVVAAVSLVALLAFAGSGWDEATDAASAAIAAGIGLPLRFSQWFLGDYVRCIATSGLIWSLCSAEIAWPVWLARGGKALADVSFSLYIMHFPLMQFFKSMMPESGPVAAGLAVVCSLAFGVVFEPQRDRIRKFLMSITRGLVPRET